MTRFYFFFRYSKDEEGFYRLQTTRFESIELAQEFLKGADVNTDDPDSDIEAEGAKDREAGQANSTEGSSASRSGGEPPSKRLGNHLKFEIGKLIFEKGFVRDESPQVLSY